MVQSATFVEALFQTSFEDCTEEHWNLLEIVTDKFQQHFSLDSAKRKMVVASIRDRNMQISSLYALLTHQKPVQPTAGPYSATGLSGSYPTIGPSRGRSPSVRDWDGQPLSGTPVRSPTPRPPAETRASSEPPAPPGPGWTFSKSWLPERSPTEGPHLRGSLNKTPQALSPTGSADLPRAHTSQHDDRINPLL